MTNITVKYSGVTKAMAHEGQNMPATRAGGAQGGAWQQNPPRFSSAEIDSVRSYMVELEPREVLHLDRMRNPWVTDIVKVLERLAEVSVKGAEMWVWIGDDRVTLRLSDRWRVKVMRDGAVVIKVDDCALVADHNFLLLCADKDGKYIPVVKGETITWDGTEEYFTSFDVIRLAREVARRILEQARWI